MNRLIFYEKKYKETGKNYAYRVLKDNIMELNLKPGELLMSESELAERLNISRTPIREVIMKLRSEFLVEVKPQTGSFVSLIDWNLINEAVFMRYTIEKEVLKEAIENISEDILMELEKNLFAQSLIVNKPGNEIEFHKLDTEFHRLLFIGTKKINIWNSIADLSTHYNRMRVLAEMKYDKNSVIQEHREYLDIIKNKDINRIDKIVTQHIKNPINKWEKLIEDNEEIAKYLKKDNN